MMAKSHNAGSTYSKQQAARSVASSSQAARQQPPPTSNLILLYEGDFASQSAPLKLGLIFVEVPGGDRATSTHGMKTHTMPAGSLM